MRTNSISSMHSIEDGFEVICVRGNGYVGGVLIGQPEAACVVKRSAFSPRRAVRQRRRHCGIAHSRWMWHHGMAGI